MDFWLKDIYRFVKTENSHSKRFFNSLDLLSGPVQYDNLLSTKEARNGWEIEMSAAIITPHLKVLSFTPFFPRTVQLASYVYTRSMHNITCHLLFHSTWIDS